MTFAFLWYYQSELAKESAENTLRIKLEDAKAEIKRTQNNLKAIMDLSNEQALSKTRILSRIIEEDPSILDDRKLMETVARDLRVEEIHVADENGKLIFSIPEGTEGFDMASTEQSRPFMDALKDRDFEFVQEPMLSGAKKKYLQYAGVARQDKKGIVQTGFSGQEIEREKKFADVMHLANIFRIGLNGRLRIIDTDPSIDYSKQPFVDDPVLSKKSEKIFYDKVNELQSLCLSSQYGKYNLIVSLPLDEMYIPRNRVLRTLMLVNIVLFIIVFLLVSILLQKVVIKGSHSFNKSLVKITEGNLQEKVDVSNTPEFTELSTGINSTVDALKMFIENEAKRIDAELQMGRTIQESVLPTEFPDEEDFRLAAGMFTAKEVGGDFYDFFMPDEKHIAFLIADVSGKGLTAALYMMNSKALIKDLIMRGLAPSEAFTAANKELSHNNSACMFVTAFICLLDTESGEMTCVNAGHNPPLLKHADAQWEYLRVKHSVVLGVSKKAKYKDIVIHLERGDRILLYTDGVTEAQSRSGELFGEERVRETLNNMTGSPSEIVAALRKKLGEFADGAEQSDDITMLVLDYFGRSDSSLDEREPKDRAGDQRGSADK